MSQEYRPGENFLRAGRCLEQTHGKCCAQERDENSAGSGEGRHSSGQHLRQSPEHSQIIAQSSQPPDTTGRDLLMLSLSLARVRPQAEAALGSLELESHQPSPAVLSEAGTGELLCSFCCNWTLNDRKSMDRTWQEDVWLHSPAVWIFKFGFQIKLEVELLSMFSALSLVEICGRISDMKGAGNEESLLWEPLCGLSKLSLTVGDSTQAAEQWNAAQSTADPGISPAHSFQAFSYWSQSARQVNCQFCLINGQEWRSHWRIF